MAAQSLDPGSAAQREALVDGARERAIAPPESQPDGAPAPALTGDVKDALARAIATQWAGPGAETAGVRNVVQTLAGSVLAFRPASQLARGWVPLVQAFQANGSEPDGRDLAMSRAAAFVLSMLPPDVRSLANLLETTSAGTNEQQEEPAAPWPAAPQPATASNGAAAPETAKDEPAGPSTADAEKVFEEVAQIANELLSATTAATGQFPPFKEAIEKALRKLEKQFGGPGVGGVQSIMDFYAHLLGKYFLSKAECEVIASTVGAVFKSTSDLGGRIEESIRDTAIKSLAVRAPTGYLVHQNSVYYASPLPAPRRLSTEATFRGTSLGDGSLTTLTAARTGGQKYFIRRFGSGQSREDLVVFTGVPPASATLLNLGLEPLPRDVAFPEFYEIKPVASVSSAPNQAFAYVHNYAVARILDWLGGGTGAWSTTPVPADPSTNSVGVPAFTLVSAAKLVAPGKHSDLLKSLRDWVKAAPPYAIIPFMVEGVWGVVPYVAIDVKGALAAAAAAAAITAMLAAIEELLKKLKRTLQEIEEVIEAIARFVQMFVLVVMLLSAVMALAVVAVLEAPLILVLGTALLLIIAAVPVGPDTKPEDAPTVFYLGSLAVNTSPRAFAAALGQAARLANGFFSQSSPAPIPKL